MENKSSSGIKRGQAITFRLPADTPDHIIRELQKLKDTERRNFSSKIADFVLEGVGNTPSKERERVTVPLPKPLSKEQRSWIRHSHSEALLGNIVYQLLADPVRAIAILASMNSTSLDIDEALYLQEEMETRHKDRVSDQRDTASVEQEVATASSGNDSMEDDDLMNFDWSAAQKESSTAQEDKSEEKVENIDDLLGGFLDRMNK